MRAWLATVAAVLFGVALVATGCGSASGSTLSGDASKLAPPDTLAFLAVDSDLGSTQLKSASAILDKFSIKPTLLASLRKAAASAGVDIDKLKSSIGPELDVAVLDVAGKTTAVGFTKPSNEQEFDAQLSPPVVHTTLDGWTIFSDTQASLDAVLHRTGNLSDVPAYQKAFDSVPSEAVARGYVLPAAIAKTATSLNSSAGSAAGSLGVNSAKWVSAGLTSHDNGLGLEVHVSGATTTATSFTSSLVDEIPGDALVALSFANAGTGLTQLQGATSGLLGQVQQSLGIDLQQIGSALSGEGIVYVRAGTLIPEVTLAIKEADPQQAEQTVGTLLGKALGGATPTATTVGGRPFHRVSVGPVDILYGTVDGQLVVTDSLSAVSELQATGDRLTGNASFKAAKKAAGLPDATQGWVYVDFKDAVPVAEGLAQKTGVQLPASVTANLTPLRSFVLYGSRDGAVQNLVAFLQTS